MRLWKDGPYSPAPLNFGNMGRNIFRCPSFREWDFSMSKIWKFGERIQMQLRGEFFNILNHPNFDVFTLNNDVSVPSSVRTTIFTPDLGSASNRCSIRVVQGISSQERK